MKKSYNSRNLRIVATIFSIMAVTLLIALGSEIFASNLGNLRSFGVFGILLALFASIVSFLAERSRKKVSESYRRQKLHVFFIYTHRDIDAAKSIARTLSDNGYFPWLFDEQVVPGEVLTTVLARALEMSTVVLVVVSKNLLESRYATVEMKKALEALHQPQAQLRSIIPVRLDDSEVPEDLSHIQWVDMREEDGTSRLLAGLKRATQPQSSDRQMTNGVSNR